MDKRITCFVIFARFLFSRWSFFGFTLIWFIWNYNHKDSWWPNCYLQGTLWVVTWVDCSFLLAYVAAAKSLQSCPTLCDPIDSSPPGSPVPGILQAKTLEWVAISFSNAWKWKVKGKSLSHVRLFATPWTAAHQAPPSMGFSMQEYWSGVPSSSL